MSKKTLVVRTPVVEQEDLACNRAIYIFDNCRMHAGLALGLARKRAKDREKKEHARGLVALQREAREKMTAAHAQRAKKRKDKFFDLSGKLSPVKTRGERKASGEDKENHPPVEMEIGDNSGTDSGTVSNLPGGNLLFGKNGESYHSLVRVDRPNDFNPFSMYVNMNLALFQHHLSVATQHGRECIDCEIVLSSSSAAPVTEPWCQGTLYHEVHAECLGCKKVFIFPTDVFNSDPTKRSDGRKKAYSQLTWRTGIAMVGLSADFVHLDTLGATRGDLCRFSRKAYNSLLFQIYTMVEVAVNDKIEQNIETSKATVRRLCADEDWSTEVLPQGQMGITERQPTYTR